MLYCFLVASVCSQSWQSPSLSSAPLWTSPDVKWRRKSQCPVLCCSAGSLPFVLLEKGSHRCGEIRELPLPAGQPLSSRRWPLSRRAARSPELTGWNPGLIKTDAKPPVDFKALAQRVTASSHLLTPLFMGLFRWGFLGQCLGGSQLSSPAGRQPAPNRVRNQAAFYQF